MDEKYYEIKLDQCCWDNANNIEDSIVVSFYDSTL